MACLQLFFSADHRDETIWTLDNLLTRLAVTTATRGVRGLGLGQTRAHESKFGRFYRKAVMRKYRQRKRNVASSKRQKIVPAVHRATGALIKGVRAQPWSLWRRAARPWPSAAPRLPRHGLSRRYPYCRARAPRSCLRRSRHRVPTYPRRPWPPDLRG